MSRFEVAVLHDYFVDRVVLIRSLERTSELILKKAAEGGGGIHGVRQCEMKGGNAVNLAYALGRLGTRVFLLTHSDSAHEPLLRSTFEGLNVTLSVKRSAPGLTVALEATGDRRRGKRIVNVMLGHSGGAGEFSPSMIDEDDWVALKESRIVCAVNWAANASGTDLLKALRGRLGKNHQIFVDPADVRDRLGEYKELLGVMRERNLANWLSLNEGEARATGTLLGIRERDLRELCRSISRELRLRVDIHADGGSYTSTGSDVVSGRSRRVVPKRLTGAGDVWDAASIHFFLEGREDGERLALANAAARYYVSGEEPEAPTRRDLLRDVNMMND